MHDLTLNVNGVDFGGWTSAKIKRSLEKIDGSFEIESTELWPDNSAPRPINTGDKCTVSIDGQVVITGFVDVVEPSYDNDKHSVKITGRDATCDLVDCSAIHKTGGWTNAKLDQIANDLCKPFGIKVLVQTDLGAVFPKWRIQEGETVYECLERAARLRGVLLMSDGQGSLILGRPSQTSIGVTLQRGVNIEKAKAKNDATKRFSQYIIKGQRPGSNDANGEAVTSQKAQSTDAAVTRYRPLVVLLEDQGQVSDFKTRAQFEATVRAARALEATITVTGWTYAGGVFGPNNLLHVTDPWLGIDRDLLIKDVDLTLDENGTRGEIGLTVADAYDVLPPKKLKRQKKGKGPDAIDLLGSG
jgi:prophage tail gpP-like protein